MNYKSKRSNMTKSLLVILILCVVSIVAVTIYSLTANKNPVEENLLQGPVTEPDNALALGETDEFDEYDLRNRYKGTEAATVPEIPTIPATEAATTAKPSSKPAEVVIPTDEAPVNAADKATPAITEKAVEVSATPQIFIKPLTGLVACVFDPDKLRYSVAMNDYRTHMGIDIESETGVPVKAVADGIVVFAGDDPLMGKTVEIDHGDGLVSVYMNLQPELPKNIATGAQLKCGDVIGGVGESSLIEITEVPHLHFEMKKNGENIDPFEYIPE